MISVFNITGHMAQDWFYTPGSKKYDLVQDHEEMEPDDVEEEQNSKVHKKHKVNLIWLTLYNMMMRLNQMT